MRIVGQLLALLLLSPVAQASAISEKTVSAREAILDGDFEQAHDLLDDAERLAPETHEPVLRQTLASIQYYRGILEYYVGDREVKALEFFKAALVHDDEFRWDVELVSEEEPQDLFELLRNEVTSRPRPSAGVPVAAITEKIYIDGTLMNSYDDVVEGRHLVQVHCADGKLKNRWVMFGDAPDYGCICSLSECFRPSFVGDESEGSSSGGSMDLVFMGGGAVALLGGVVVNFALLNPVWTEIEAARSQPHALDREDAEILENQFSQRRALTLGLMGGGLAMSGVGTALFFMDAELRWGLSGSGAWLSGQF